jgi:hypothetical protein
VAWQLSANTLASPLRTFTLYAGSTPLAPTHSGRTGSGTSVDLAPRMSAAHLVPQDVANLSEVPAKPVFQLGSVMQIRRCGLESLIAREMADS